MLAKDNSSIIHLKKFECPAYGAMILVSTCKKRRDIINGTGKYADNNAIGKKATKLSLQATAEKCIDCKIANKVDDGTIELFDFFYNEDGSVYLNEAEKPSKEEVVNNVIDICKKKKQVPVKKEKEKNKDVYKKKEDKKIEHNNEKKLIKCIECNGLFEEENIYKRLSSDMKSVNISEYCVQCFNKIKNKKCLESLKVKKNIVNDLLNEMSSNSLMHKKPETIYLKVGLKDNSLEYKKIKELAKKRKMGISSVIAEILKKHFMR